MIMNNIELEAEALQVSIYCNIVCDILFKHRKISLNKILPFAYLVKKEKTLCQSIYNSQNIKFLVNKAFSTISGEYKIYCNNIEFIIKAIHLLIQNGNVKFENDILFFVSRGKYNNECYNENSFIFNAIENSKFKEDYQILKEVVQNV